MKALKQLAERVESSSTNQQTDSKEPFYASDFIESAVVEASQYYLFGVYEAYCFLNKINSLAPEDVLKKMKGLPTIEKEKRHAFLRNSKDDFYNFLGWYFYEYKKNMRD